MSGKAVAGAAAAVGGGVPNYSTMEGSPGKAVGPEQYDRLIEASRLVHAGLWVQFPGSAKSF